MKQVLNNFIDFIRTQGVIGLAIGIVLGGAVTKLVASLVGDIINPIVGIFLGNLGDLKNLIIPVFSAKIMIGNFISTVIDFSIISAIVYFVIKGLGFDKLDKPKA